MLLFLTYSKRTWLFSLIKIIKFKGSVFPCCTKHGIKYQYFSRYCIDVQNDVSVVSQDYTKLSIHMRERCIYTEFHNTVCPVKFCFLSTRRICFFLKGAGRSRAVLFALFGCDYCSRTSAGEEANNPSMRGRGPVHLCAKYASAVIEIGLVCSSTISGGIFVPQLDLHKHLSASTRKPGQLSGKQLRAIWTTTKPNHNETDQSKRGRGNNRATFNIIIIYCGSN